MERAFSDLVEDYSVIFFDAYGVLKNSAGLIDGVVDLLGRLKDAGKDLYVVTNDASKSPETMSRPFCGTSQGDLLPPDRFINSGLMARDYLREKIREGKVAYLGKPDSAFYIEDAGLQPVPVLECPEDEDIKAVVLLDDEGFDWQPTLNHVLNILRRRWVPVVVANSDPAYPVNDRHVAIAVGSLGDLMQGLVRKRFIWFGKPDAYMFSFAYTQAQLNNPGLAKRDILMVGDTLLTDILGGNKFGIDTALVLSGNTDPGHYRQLCEACGVFPDFVSSSILE